MRAPKVNAAAFATLGAWLTDPPPPPPKAKVAKAWMPILTPTQVKAWDSTTRNLLCWSEKFSGKTWICGQKLVRHCYDNNNALAVILVAVKSMADKGGILDKLTNFILPTWRDGNRDRDGKLLDEGIGLYYSDAKYDKQGNPMIYLQNRHGGWSKIVIISAPHANQLRKRIRGYEASFVFVDELTSCDSEIYFSAVSAQVGRVKGIPLQQYVAACNPEGESHWVYQKWFVKAYDEEKGEWRPEFENIYFPRDENRVHVGDEYFDSLTAIYGDDPVEAARMIEGFWKDRVSGDGLFLDLFSVPLHIRPLFEDGKIDYKHIIQPHPDYPIIMGLDPGAVYNVFVLKQWLPVEGKMKWVIFDEVALFQQKIGYAVLVPIVQRRLRHWRQLLNKEIPFVCISDDSAFTVFRPGQGTYDVLDIQREWEANRHKYGLEALKIRACPKFSNSRAARIRILQKALSQDEIIISSFCRHTKAMIEQLRSEPQKEGTTFDPDKAMTPRRCDHLHVFDSLTYPMLAGALQPSLLTPVRSDAQTLISAAA